MLRDTTLLNVEGSGLYRSHGPTLVIGVGDIPIISVFFATQVYQDLHSFSYPVA